MKESHSRIAVLHDVEEDVFIGFCEYSYTGTYMTPDNKTKAVEEKSSASASNDIAFEPNGLSVKDDKEVLAECEKKTPAEETFPSTEPSVVTRKPYLDGKKSKKKKRPSFFWSERKALAEKITEKPLVDITSVYPYGRLWEEFRARSLAGQRASISLKPDLQFHAKLYVFATRFLIEELRTQCLKSLQQDLCHFMLYRNKIPQILDLLEYTYANTGQYELGGQSRLRELVIHNVACEARTLADQDRLRSLLASNGEIASDLVMIILS
jgi:hypothetical protein